MTSQNDRQDRSLTGQVRDQAGQCPLTGRYFQPWWSLKGSGCLLQMISTTSSIVRCRGACHLHKPPGWKSCA